MRRSLPVSFAACMLAFLFFTLATVLVGCRHETGVSPLAKTPGKTSLTPLMIAARKGDLSSVSRLLRNGARVNDADADGYTALHYAAHCGDVRVADALVAAGADLNARTNENVTPLISSIDMACGKPEITLALIQAGADVNAAESDGDTALWIATTESSLQVMKELLKRGANPDVQAKGGETPLHMAAMNGLVDRVELLLQFGARPTVRNAQGKTPLDVANKRSPEVINLLQAHSHPND